MSGHTPGPWVVEPEHFRGGIYVEPTVTAGIDDGLPQGVASVRVGLPGTDANARLIAAAPDLLVAARVFVAYHTGEGLKRRTGSGVDGCSNCGGRPHSATCHVKLFEAVIAKAEGR